ncbi:GntR family transcriptional regulator [Brevibacillus choshinensis]|uniref:GntR family transcriptional regulator n=1 Tax=Brevibacillus choshinensis TaxID=54911 RepID=UPI002E1CEBE4|nr:GntR family transcriptional regulator [Brevibacillus choshinensis]MED4583129.1 GntR family transcriptional regulator [Brevibacillus choshinensis]MED4781375.1 GntR family transcriptional regulator [Brevibacillus choshinensis]
MKVSVNETLSIPIHVQLKEQIKTLIHEGLYQPREQIPGARELAGFLRMNRNTVQKAYTELEQEGYVQTKSDDGVFVHSQPPHGSDRILGAAMDQELDMEMSQEQPDDPHAFSESSMTMGYSLKKATKPVLLFVECNVPQAQEYAVELEKATGYVVKPCLIKDLDLLGSSIQSGYYDLIVTTFLHVEEVQPIITRLCGENEPKVIACLMESNLQSIKRLQELPAGSKVGIAGTTWQGADNFRQSIVNAELSHVELLIGSLEYPASLDAIIESKPDLIVSTSIVSSYLQRLSRYTPMMVEDRCLSAQSVHYIQQYVEGKRALSDNMNN